MNARVRELQLAAMILTRLPAGRIDGDAPPISASVWAFPVIGAAVGAIAGIAFVAAGWIGLPALAAALFAIAVGTLATGALHEDGLAGEDHRRQLQLADPGVHPSDTPASAKVAMPL